MKPFALKKLSLTLAVYLLLSFEQASAVEIEPLKSALLALLKTPKVFKKQIRGVSGPVDVFYSKDGRGSADKMAFIEHGIYEPNCTHTWAIGVDKKTGKISQVRVLEYSCPHAAPINSSSFLDQYKGKAPVDVKKLDAKVTTIAKATGSCRLTTDAVKRTLKNFYNYRGQF